MTQLQLSNASKIMMHYGRSNQLLILQEECAELIQSVSKIRRGASGADESFIDEMADVSIMIAEFLTDFDEDEKTEYYKKINEKLERQLKRIKEEKGR